MKPVKFKPTKEQMSIMKHALGIGPGITAYRNHYVAGEGHHSMPHIKVLLEELLMVKVATPLWMHPTDIVYMVTNEGKAFCKGIRTK